MNTGTISFVFCIWYTMVEINGEIAITASTGAYFEKLRRITVYEKSVPILYTVPLEFLDFKKIVLSAINQIPRCNQNASLACLQAEQSENILRLVQNLESLNKAIVADFMRQSKDSDLESFRKKRGIQFLGDWYKFCCNLITAREGKILTGNQISLKKGYELLKESVMEHHASLINITSEVTKFSSETYGTLRNLVDRLDNLKKWDNTISHSLILDEQIIAAYSAVWEYYNALVQVNNKISYTLTSCKNRFIPSLVISKDQLRKDLINLSNNAKRLGLTLAIPYDKISKYFHLAIVSCNVYNDTLEIDVKIPLKRTSSVYEVYNFVPITFKSHDDMLCKWEQEKAILIVDSTNDEIKTLSESDFENCNEKLSLCYLPHTRGASNTPQCARSLFKEDPYERIIHSCAFKCERNHGEAIV